MPHLLEGIPPKGGEAEVRAGEAAQIVIATVSLLTFVVLLIQLLVK